MLVDLVRAPARDGLRLDGMLREPSRSPAIAADAVLLLHGVGANFYASSTLDALVPALHELGLATLQANTRGHDTVYMASFALGGRKPQGAAYELVDDCRHDIAGWIEFLAGRGRRRVILLGHSLGAVKAVYAQAQEPHPAVAAVVAISPPRLSHRCVMLAPESAAHFESLQTAEQMVAQGRGGELFTARFPFPLLITAAGYIDKYGPAERYNIVAHAPRLATPALFTYGGKELDTGGIPFAGVPDALRAAPAATVRDVEIVPAADHLYTGLADQLAEVVSRWLIERLSG